MKNVCRVLNWVEESGSTVADQWSKEGMHPRFSLFPFVEFVVNNSCNLIMSLYLMFIFTCNEFTM